MGPPQCLMLDTGEAPVPPSWPDTCIQENLVNATRTRQAHACRRHRLGLGNTCSIADTGTSKIEKDSRAHLDDVGIGLGHAGCHCPNAGLGHQLDADLALRRHLHSMAQHIQQMTKDGFRCCSHAPAALRTSAAPAVCPKQRILPIGNAICSPGVFMLTVDCLQGENGTWCRSKMSCARSSME